MSGSVSTRLARSMSVDKPQEMLIAPVLRTLYLRSSSPPCWRDGTVFASYTAMKVSSRRDGTAVLPHGMRIDPTMEGAMTYASIHVRKDVLVLVLLPLLAIALAGVSGCSGDWPQSTAYEDGEYRGKPDNLPWQSAGFSGSEHEWQKAIDARTQGQNEYQRIENQ